MGMDKALLQFNGRLMLAIALETLRSVCDDVFIAGNREDLAEYAPVVGETRIGEGPAAGIESALRAAQQEWIMALPIDLPLMSAELLRRWMAAGLGCTAGARQLSGVRGGLASCAVPSAS